MMETKGGKEKLISTNPGNNFEFYPRSYSMLCNTIIINKIPGVEQCALCLPFGQRLAIRFAGTEMQFRWSEEPLE